MSTRDTKEGQKPKQTKYSPSRDPKFHRPQDFTRSCGLRLSSVQIGPVMTVGDVLAAGKKGGTPIEFNETIVQPTAKELHERCAGLLKDLPDEGTEGKPVFGPEKPPKTDGKGEK
ncbi:hypothetical protein LTR56_010365 [Elasticomyces elasticus]|nr:hypothetical protein LTR56_010365 [Elasticomyces elasticus]KAK3656933.1 hypothetical protein LTR22_009595 [Elasticomyces elasticus]KAK4926064.1 hypothetical protein LTR49_006979 [Elasticomyces elasticus]KAK5766165.1 hypothetical protein LTS12_003648 [Elasticomyces elasticus]